MFWSINQRKPNGVSQWRWVLGNLHAKLLWVCGLHWKQRKSVLTHHQFLARIRWRQREDAMPWDKILRRDPCAYCNGTYSLARMTVEHVIPRSHGGFDRSVNKVGACARCNRERGSLPLLIFLRERQRAARDRDYKKLAVTMRQTRRAQAKPRPAGKPHRQMKPTRYSAPPLSVTIAEAMRTFKRPTLAEMRKHYAELQKEQTQ